MCAALVGQLAILWWSLDGFLALSVFCTVATTPMLWVFNGLHYVYAGLALLGLLSLRWARARLPYLMLLLVTALALPVQLWPVQHGYLTCDGP